VISSLFLKLFPLSLLAFSGFGGGKAAAETRKELTQAAQSGLGFLSAFHYFTGSRHDN